ncbi:MAG: hypothetical protein WEB90_00430 [Gemmatimonadota bacterium]
MSETQPGGDLLRELFGMVSDVVVLIGADRKVWFVNRLEAGYRAEDAIGVDALAFVAPDQHAQWLRHFDQPLEVYLEQVSDSRVTHGMCPECEARLSGGGDRQTA